MSLKVVEYLFSNSKDAVLETLRLLEESHRLSEKTDDGLSVEKLQFENDKITKQLDNLYLEKLAEKRSRLKKICNILLFWCIITTKNNSFFTY